MKLWTIPQFDKIAWSDFRRSQTGPEGESIRTIRT